MGLFLQSRIIPGGGTRVHGRRGCSDHSHEPNPVKVQVFHFFIPVNVQIKKMHEMLPRKCTAIINSTPVKVQPS